MAKTARTESLPTSNGTCFTVGSGVHWGFNGDRYPGTVLYVSDSGRRVYVSDDEFKVRAPYVLFSEGDLDCEFTTVLVSPDKCRVFTLRKDGRFTDASGRGGLTLCHGRCYAQNPSF